jgi:hypothetical protein
MSGSSASGRSRWSRSSGSWRTRPAARRRIPRGAAAALRAQGEARDLSAHVGRSAASRFVRLQARAREARRAVCAGRVREGQGVRLHLGHAAPHGHAADVFPARQGRPLDVGCDSAFSVRRRRPLRHQVDVHGAVQPHPGRAAAAHRLAARGPALDGLVGDLRAGLGKPEPARICGADQ